MRTDLYCAFVPRYDGAKLSNVFMGDRLTVGKTRSEFTKQNQRFTLQRHHRFIQTSSAICNAPSRLYGGL